MVTILYLIRHGETEGAPSNRYKGHTDVPLSEKGVKQMERVSAFIQNMIHNTGYRMQDKKNHESCIVHRASSTLSAVYCSDLSRAVKSAGIIAEPYGLKPVIMPELRERNFGLWEGMSFDEIKEKYPDEFGAWTGDPLKFSPMHGESTIEVRDRVIKALNNLLSKYIREITEHRAQSTDKDSLGSVFCNLCSESIAIVSHGGVNRIILCHLLGMPLENIFRIEQDYGALNVIEFYENYPVVKLINYAI